MSLVLVFLSFSSAYGQPGGGGTGGGGTGGTTTTSNNCPYQHLFTIGNNYYYSVCTCPGPNPQNVVLVLNNQLNANQLGCNGNDCKHSPGNTSSLGQSTSSSLSNTVKQLLVTGKQPDFVTKDVKVKAADGSDAATTIPDRASDPNPNSPYIVSGYPKLVKADKKAFVIFEIKMPKHDVDNPKFYTIGLEIDSATLTDTDTVENGELEANNILKIGTREYVVRTK